MKQISASALFFGLAALATMAPGLSASTITYITPSNSSIAAGAVDAQAVFSIRSGVLQITLSDLLANPKDAGQLVSDLEFTLNSSLSGPGYSSSAQYVTVAANGTPTTGSTGATGWGFGTTGAKSYTLCVICGNGITFYNGVTAQPSQEIIGPTDGSGMYSNANSSIAGNSPHNPFLNGSATFTIDDASITSDTVVTSATFSFGTTAGVDVDGNRPGSVPEPSAIFLTASGFGAMLLGFARRRKA